MHEIVKGYWHVFLTLATAIGFIVYWTFWSTPTDVGGVAQVIAIVMTTILGLQVAESFDLRSRFQELRTAMPVALRDALYQHESAQLVPFRRTADYIELFDDLEDRCYIYNPHQFAPDTTDVDPDAIVASTVRRYQNAQFLGMRYLICVGDDYGVQNFTRFCSRLRKVHERSPKPHLIEDKVRVGILHDRGFRLEPTYHIQQKRVPRNVIELRLAPLTVTGSSIPNFYMTSTSSELRAMLQAHFDATWVHAKEINVRDILARNFDVNERSIKVLIGNAAAAPAPNRQT